MRRSAGTTLLELLFVVSLMAMLLAVAWALFVSYYRRVADAQSAAAALEHTVVLLERVGRDVEEMMMPPTRSGRPFSISTDGRGISFYIPDRDAPSRSASVARPVTYHLAPRPDGTNQVRRDGQPLGGVVVADLQFAFVPEGALRKSESGMIGGGSDLGDLGNELGPLFVSNRPFPGERGVLEKIPAAGPTAMTTAPAPSTPATTATTIGALIPPDSTLGHAGPFLLFRFTAVDAGGAAVRRAVLYDLVNLHMLADHGREFDWPDWAMELHGKLTRFQANPGASPAQPVGLVQKLGEEDW